MNVSIYCDGSATTAKLPGGYAFIILVDGVKKAEVSGHLSQATNNVAEITAAISGLEYVLNDPSLSSADSIELVSDSQLTLRYATGEYQCRKYHLVPLFCKLRQLHDKLKITTRWVRGHAGDTYNEECDKLAKSAREGKTVNRLFSPDPEQAGSNECETAS